jgi:hypothetical protein
MRRSKVLVLLVIGLAVVAGGIGIVVAMGSSEADVPIAREALERASAAALAHVGGGTVTETEVGDEDGYYEVEVTRADGRQVDVHLDAGFNVISVEDDDDSGEDNDID